MSSAAKVGALVVGFGALLYGAYATLGRSFFEPETVTYKVHFRDAGGVVSGSNVLLSGVKVGSVSEVTLVEAGKAEVRLALRKDLKIPKGTQAVLTTSLVGIGDRPVELVPPERPTGEALNPSESMQGRIKGALEGIVPDTSETMAELNRTLKATSGLLEDQSLRTKFEKLLDSTNTTVAQFGVLAARIDRMAGENQATLRNTLLQASAVMRDVSKTTSAIARIATDGKLEGKALKLMDEMTLSIKQTQGLVADIGAKVNDPELSNSIKGILTDTKTMTESGTRIAANTEEMTKNGIELSKQATEIATKASALADQLSELLKKADKTLGGIANIGGSGGGVGKIDLDARFIRETDPGRFRAEVEAGVDAGKEKVYLGLWDAFESNKLIAQLGYKVNDKMDLRYGVYASQLGVGVQYRIAPGVWARGDLFGFNEPRFDFRTRFELKNGVNAWLGVDKVFDRTAPSLGIGIRR